MQAGIAAIVQRLETISAAGAAEGAEIFDEKRARALSHLRKVLRMLVIASHVRRHDRLRDEDHPEFLSADSNKSLQRLETDPTDSEEKVMFLQTEVCPCCRIVPDFVQVLLVA